jgi:hypothetical protein
MSTVYVTVPPPRYRGRHRRSFLSASRIGLAVLGAVWAVLGTCGALATSGVGR